MFSLFNESSNYTDNLLDDLFRAVPGSDLVAVKKQVTRDGSNFEQTFWVKPGDVKHQIPQAPGDVHILPHPQKPGDTIKVLNKYSPKRKRNIYHVFDSSDKKIRPPVQSPQDFSAWYQRTAGSQTYNDIEGNPFITIRPMVSRQGTTKEEENPRVKLIFHKESRFSPVSGDVTQEGVRGKTIASFKTLSLQAAKAEASRRLAAMKEGGKPEENKPASQVTPGKDIGGLFLSGELTHAYDAKKGRKLNVTPELKEHLIGQAVRESWDHIASQLVHIKKMFGQDPRVHDQVSALVGMTVDPRHLPEGNLKIAESPLKTVVNSALDRFSLDNGAPFKAYLDASIDAKLISKFTDAIKKQRREVDMTGGLSAKHRSGTKTLTERLADPGTADDVGFSSVQAWEKKQIEALKEATESALTSKNPVGSKQRALSQAILGDEFFNNQEYKKLNWRDKLPYIDQLVDILQHAKLQHVAMPAVKSMYCMYMIKKALESIKTK